MYQEVALTPRQHALHLYSDLQILCHKRQQLDLICLRVHCRDVIATEERMLHLLRSVPQGNCEWIRKSRLPEKFLQLDDSLLEKLEEQHPQLHGEVQMLEGPSGGWRAVGSPWIVPEALAPATRTISVLQQQVLTAHHAALMLLSSPDSRHVLPGSVGKATCLVVSRFACCMPSPEVCV